MSATRSATEANIRLLIDDNNPDQYAISSVRMHQFVQGEMQLIAARTFLPMESVLSVPLVAGTFDYTLTGIVGDVRQVVRHTDGIPLQRQTLDYMVGMWRQDSAAQVGTSPQPLDYAILETSAQLVRIRLGPTPSSSAVSVDVYYGVMSASLTADSSTIPFSAPLLRALERACASECVAVMSRADRDARMIDVASVGLWRELSEQGIREENLRLRVTGSGTQPNVIETDA